MSRLYVVATPIGNLDDITVRAVNVLKEVDVIACEDTRHTQGLLNHLEITGKRIIACHAHNETASSQGIIRLLQQGLDVAYCSDAGTPGVSDPGSILVKAVRSAGFDIVPVPGASACVTLVSAAGMTGKTFTFEGFLSPKSGKRRKRLEELLTRNEAFIVYESPFRIVKTLEEIRNLDNFRQIVLGREITKAFEQFLCGTASEILSQLKTVKGEFAFIVMPPSKTEENDSENESDELCSQ